MPLEPTPQVTPPQKSEKKLLIGVAVLIGLMFVMIAVIIVRLTGQKP